MKKSHLTVGAAAITAIIAVSGFAFSSFAADDAEVEKSGFFNQHKAMYMTDEQKLEWQEKMKERKAEMTAKHEAVKAALEASDYEAWLEAVGEDCPILDKINQDNFFQLAEAHKLREEARVIMEELGIEKGQFKHKFKHRGLGGMGPHMEL